MGLGANKIRGSEEVRDYWFIDESFEEPNAKFEKENLTNSNFNCLFSLSPFVYRKIFTNEYYTSGYFPRTGTTG